MTSLLYLFQASVVFLCPAFFGWVVLRRVVREHDWLVLLPGSVVIGCVALMATMKELRYWLGMSIGAWVAYKVFFAGPFCHFGLHTPATFRPSVGGRSQEKTVGGARSDRHCDDGTLFWRAGRARPPER